MLLFYYIFAALMVLGSVAVVASRNPVHSVLWLIFTFLNSAGIFILLGAEFIAMTVVIVYVGAVAVLFLFVVMMMDIDITEIRQKLQNSGLIIFSIVAVLFAEIILLIRASLSGAMQPKADFILNSDNSSNLVNSATNTHKIGEVLYTDYFLSFQLSGLVLLLAMVGCIVLTLRSRKGVKKQDVLQQMLRSSQDSIKLVKVKKGAGINENLDQ